MSAPVGATGSAAATDPEAAARTCRVRPARPGDEAALALVAQASFLEAFAVSHRGSDILEHCTAKSSRQVFRDWLADTGSAVWIAETVPSAAPVGYLVMTGPEQLPLPDLAQAPADLEVRRVYLLHRFQRSGLGRRLMQAAREEAERRGARRLLLGVYGRNELALAFYAALGYRPVGRRTFRIGETVCEDEILALPLTSADR